MLKRLAVLRRSVIADSRELDAAGRARADQPADPRAALVKLLPAGLQDRGSEAFAHPRNL